MYLIAALYSFLIACDWVNAITISANGNNENNSTQHSFEPVERMRRLIPYMTFYVAAPSREYLPVSDEYNYKQVLYQKPETHKQSATIAASYDSQQYYTNSGAAPTTTRPSSTSNQQLPIFLGSNNNIANANHNPYLSNVTELHAIVLNAQPQQAINSNQYVASVVDLVIPQRKLRPTNNFYSIKAESDVAQHASPQQNKHNYVTPFLASNQLPGPFRPILNSRNRTKPLSTKHRPINTILRQPPPLPPLPPPPALPSNHHVDILTEPKPIYFTPQQSKQNKYSTYLQPQTEFIELVSSTEQPITNNNIDEPAQLVPTEHATKPVLTYTTKIRPVTHQHDYAPQQQPIPAFGHLTNPKTTHLLTSVNYDLDPDDGYGGKLPYNYYSAKYQKVQSHRQQSFNKFNKYPLMQSSIEMPRIKPATLKTPVKYAYGNAPVGGFESTSEQPYRLSVTTQDIHQHLTETTQGQAQSINENNLYHASTVDASHQRPTYDDSYHNEINTIANHNTFESVTPVAVDNSLEDVLGHLNTTSLQYLLSKMQEENYLPKTFSINNLDNSMKTLAKILINMKKTQKLPKPQYDTQPPPPKSHPNEEHYDDVKSVYTAKPSTGYKSAPGPNSGRAGIDYPNLSAIPPTHFNCSEQRYKGFFGDPETDCQVWHYCDLNGGQASFLCPNGTIFSQVLLTCDWWFNVKCSTTAQLYVLNERLYKYILPLSPKFPEDYSGPLVDKYLAIKFQEMEEKMRRQKNKNRVKSEGDDEVEEESETDETPTMVKGDGESLIDDDGQNHNIDNAIQQYTSDAESHMHIDSTEYSKDDVTNHPEDAIIYTANGENLTNDHRHVYQTTTYSPMLELRKPTTPQMPPLPPPPPPPKIQVESERLEVIEISSDGSSGHLTPGRNR